MKGKYITVIVKVSAEDVREIAPDITDEQVEVFLEQLKPRLDLILNGEARDYLNEAVKFFSKEGDVNE